MSVFISNFKNKKISVSQSLKSNNFKLAEGILFSAGFATEQKQVLRGTQKQGFCREQKVLAERLNILPGWGSAAVSIGACGASDSSANLGPDLHF